VLVQDLGTRFPVDVMDLVILPPLAALALRRGGFFFFVSGNEERTI
jgi:hypothetical protein